MIIRHTVFHLTALAIAISSALSLSTAFADGGAHGADGDDVKYGGISHGKPGIDGYAVENGSGVDGTDLTGHILNIDNNLTGTAGKNGGAGNDGGAGAGGQGGSSVFGGLSSGGAAGTYYYDASASPIVSLTSAGGSGGSVYGNSVSLTNVTLTGAIGGNGGDSVNLGKIGSGGAGVGGQGGGSVYGGLSSGGAGGNSSAHPSSTVATSSSGGNGGNVYDNIVTLSNVALIGGKGGNGGDVLIGLGAGGGAGGQGGGSVYGGLSSGGAGGYSATGTATTHSSSAGGNGGSIYGNSVTLTNVRLTGALGGNGGDGSSGWTGLSAGDGAAGQGGGSVFGGLSSGGAGGYASGDANGGKGGDVFGNKISLSGASSLTGSIYGGFSQGGAAGVVNGDGMARSASIGLGGLTNNNIVTLEGTDLTIGGSVYGGYSVNGDGSVIYDATFTNHYQGNTLNLHGYRGAVEGVYNFENYNWVLPKDVVNGDALITIAGNNSVALDNTKHSIAMEDDGNRLDVGDAVTLINKAEGNPTLTTKEIRQGQFLVYDVSLAVVNKELVLNVDGGTDTTPDDTPAGEINPTSKAFLEGRIAMASLVNEGADLISDRAISAARTNSLAKGSGLFLVTDGGSSRYSTGSHVDLRSVKLAIGFSHGFTLDDQNVLTAGVFMEHGSGSYDSQNHFDGVGRIKGNGDARYTGGGVLADLSGLGGNGAAAPSGAEEGGYVSAALRAGRTHHSFESSDLVAFADGASADYSSNSNYFSAMAGGGYILSLGGRQTLDMYGRYTWSSLDTTKTNVGNSTLKLDTAQSSRVRVGARYNYTTSETLTPFVGVAYEHEFLGEAGGRAYGMNIDSPSTKGNMGIVETGITMKPWKDKEALSMDASLQGFFGKRVGGLGGLTLKYAF
ncbi:autotransporter [Pseudomonas helleri]|uniref:autotransporter n=1 Tax=Pseudomonas helleri TaxID=1608996 RepID=UPI002430E507|nr:autotransporter [Pseudomonas helleri]